MVIERCGFSRGVVFVGCSYDMEPCVARSFQLMSLFSSCFAFNPLIFFSSFCLLLSVRLKVMKQSWLERARIVDHNVAAAVVAAVIIKPAGPGSFHMNIRRQE